MSELGDRVKERRRDLGFSQRKLADRVGVSQAFIQRIETQRIKTIRRPVLAQLAEALNVSDGWLRDGTGQADRKPDDAGAFRRFLDILIRLDPEMQNLFCRFCKDYMVVPNDPDRLIKKIVEEGKP